MKTFSQKKLWINSPSFALISVLALVSLAALTATAFLASARLERQATSSIGMTTRLEMALNSGKVCASQVINDNSQSDVGGNTHIVTCWRTNWTDEIGYPFIGQIKTSGTSGQQSAIWYYFPLFSPAGVTNLDTNVIQNAMRFTNTHQGTFSNDMQNFMTLSATSGFANNPGLTNPKCVQIPLLGGRTSPPVGWVYINQEKRKFGSNLTNTSPAVRIAWFAEDLEGLIDAERMGASTLRATGTNSEEISITNATDTNGSKIITSISTFTNARKAFISYGLLANSNVSGITNSTNARYFASGLRAWAPTNPASPNNGALAWIPAGIPISGSSTLPKGYSNQGYTKLNLNKLVSDTPAVAVANIAAVITNNLPNFGARSGAMNSNAYISNIAANIVDYADPDSTPTVDVGDNPTYLGIENIPWPNELFDRITFTEVTSAGLIRIELKDYVEVWNMGNSNIPSGTTITLSNNYDMVLTMTNRGSGTAFAPVFFKTNLTNFTTESGSFGQRQFTLPSPLLPNGYQVLESSTGPSTRRLSVQIPNTISSAYWTDALVKNNWAIFSPSADITANMTYTALVGGKVIQKSISGRSPRFLAPSFAITPPSGAYIFCNNIGYASQSTPTSTQPRHTGGDPRAQLFLSGILYQQNYTNQYATPGGRNRTYYWQPGGIGPTTGQGGPYLESEVNPAKYWPDNGHTNSADYGGNPTAFSQSPTSFPPLVPPLTNNYVMKRNDTGTLTNIIELGNIYDPMQWGDQAGSGVAQQPGLWTNLTSSATNDSRFGGRNTLRIGRPEFTRFAFTNMYGNSVPSIPNMGRSSAALLDLFCLTNGTNVSGGPYSMGGGKINLNTAPAPVLRALAGGILLTNDPAQLPASYTMPAAMAEAFAQGVMRFRSKYPFLTPSHLSFIGTDPTWPNTTTWPTNSVFGNTNAISLTTVPGNTLSTTSIGINEWNDQAAEEWFSKIYALSSCQSHNYRIYVVAQLVATNSAGQTNAIGPLVKKYYQIYARNGSSASGLATDSTYPNNPIYTWQPTVGVIDIYKSTY